MVNEVLRTKYTIDFVFYYIIFRIGIILTNESFVES
jgi:hypothetical protein